MLPDDFIFIMKTTEDQSLLKRFSGKALLRIAGLLKPIFNLGFYLISYFFSLF